MPSSLAMSSNESPSVGLCAGFFAIGSVLEPENIIGGGGGGGGGGAGQGAQLLSELVAEI